jgi:hypothetical protein
MTDTDRPPSGPDMRTRICAATLLLVMAAVWSVAWKGVSMWRAAQNESKPWFTTLLITNTLGILDAFYLFAVDRRTKRLGAVEQEILASTGEPEQLGHPQET